MVARDALVIGERGQRELGPFFCGIAEVDVVGAGTRPIERPGLVIAARRARFGEFRHALDLECRARKRAAYFRHARPNGFHLRVQIRQQARAAGVGVRIDLIRAARQGVQALGQRAVRHPLRPQDRVHLSVQRRRRVPSPADGFRRATSWSWCWRAAPWRRALHRAAASTPRRHASRAA